MTLRNAFEGLATERTLARLLNMVSWARDSSDRLRVVVDAALPAGGASLGTVGLNAGTQTIGTVGISAGAQVTAAPPGAVVLYGANAAFQMDAREQQRTFARQNFMMTRQKWTFT